MEAKTRLAALTDWVKAEAAPAKGLLVPVSGGSDSALVFWLLNQVYPNKTLGVHAGDKEKLRCRNWLESVGTVHYVSVVADEGVDLDDARWFRFLSLAKRTKYWLVGPRNRSETVLGTFSLASRLGTFMPIAGTWKTDVMELCGLVGVPDEILASSRRADPECGRPQEMAEVPLESIDLFLRVHSGELAAEALAGLSKEEIDYLSRVLKLGSWRHKLPKCGPQW